MNQHFTGRPRASGVMVPALALLFRVAAHTRMTTIVVSALVAHTALHWTYDRVGALRQFPWPALTAADVATGLRWLMALLVLAALAWTTMLIGRRSRGEPDPPALAEGELRRGLAEAMPEADTAPPAGGYTVSANRTSV